MEKNTTHPNTFIDTHCHLMGEEYDQDRFEVVKRMEQRNVLDAMIITLDDEETQQALDFLAQYKGPVQFRIAAGLFVDQATTYTEEEFTKLEKRVKDPRISCVGEIGLDYYWEKDPAVHQAQKRLFQRQMDLALQVQKPILIHSREAMQDTYDMLEGYQGRALLHCYAGSLEMAERFNKIGVYCALGGALTFKNNRVGNRVVEGMDVRYLLSETDSPYMSPVPVRGTRNEPSNIPYIVEHMASLRKVSTEEMAQTIYENWMRFLDWPQVESMHV